MALYTLVISHHRSSRWLGSVCEQFEMGDLRTTELGTEEALGGWCGNELMGLRK